MSALELNDISNRFCTLTVSENITLMLKKGMALCFIDQLYLVKNFLKVLKFPKIGAATSSSIFDFGGG